MAQPVEFRTTAVIGASDEWLSVYLFCNEPFEPMLTGLVKPAIEEIMARRWATMSFFIRYWEDGPHIRLRFKGQPDLLEKEVKPYLLQCTQTYFAHQQPAQSQQGTEEQSFTAGKTPPGTIQFMHYEPEIERYGGPQAVLVSEKHFEASSRAVLSILSGCEGWNYQTALGYIMQLHIAFAHAAGMDLAETAAFFDAFCAAWTPAIYLPKGAQLRDLGGMSPTEFYARWAETTQAFQESYHKQRSVLVPFIQQVWEALTEQEEFEDEWMNQWIRDVRQTNELLEQVRAVDCLLLPSWYVFNPAVIADIEQAKRWTVFESYVHMTNNRLGIVNRDEGYVGYLMKTICREVALGMPPLA
jgi:hypothetical protein